MYKIGDKILYPVYGAGKIARIEEQKVLGEKKEYFIMEMPLGDMKVMIPVDACDKIGIRDIISAEEGKKVLEHFHNDEILTDDNWNRRQRENMAKMKSGDIYKVLEVVKTLMFRERTKGLSTSERKMLGISKQIFVSELIMSGVADRTDIESIMQDTIEGLLGK